MKRRQLYCPAGCGVLAVRNDSSALVHADGSSCVKTCSGCAEQVTYDAGLDLFTHQDGTYSWPQASTAEVGAT